MARRMLSSNHSGCHTEKEALGAKVGERRQEDKRLFKKLKGERKVVAWSLAGSVGNLKSGEEGWGVEEPKASQPQCLSQDKLTKGGRLPWPETPGPLKLQHVKKCVLPGGPQSL